MRSSAPTTLPAPAGGTDLVEEMLALAHELVREGWCQGAAARDDCGRAVAPTSSFARSWSASGALERVWAHHEDRFGDALDAFERANLALAASTGTLPQAWNDAEGRTVRDVLDALAEAVRVVSGTPRDTLVPKVDSSSS